MDGVKFVVAADDEALRTRLLGILRSIGQEPVLVGNSGMAYRMSADELNYGWLLLDTADNVHLLTQIINDLHHAPFFLGGSVSATCFVSEESFRQNPSLGFWLINGGAAIGMLWTREMSDAEMAESLSILNSKLLRRSGEDPPLQTPHAELTRAVQLLADAPYDAGGWLRLAELLMDRRNPWKRRFELCEVLLNEVLERDPGSTRGRVLLAEVLFSLSKPAAAIQQCREALRREPDCADAHHRLGALLCSGLMHSSSGTLLEEARWHLDEAIRLGGNSSVATWARNVRSSLDRRSEQPGPGCPGR